MIVSNCILSFAIKGKNKYPCKSGSPILPVIVKLASKLPFNVSKFKAGNSSDKSLFSVNNSASIFSFLSRLPLTLKSELSPNFNNDGSIISKLLSIVSKANLSESILTESITELIKNISPLPVR